MRNSIKAGQSRKTLTIPEWLNDIAMRENVNFSNVLQNALMERLKLISELIRK